MASHKDHCTMSNQHGRVSYFFPHGLVIIFSLYAIQPPDITVNTKKQQHVHPLTVSTSGLLLTPLMDVLKRIIENMHGTVS